MQRQALNQFITVSSRSFLYSLFDRSFFTIGLLSYTESKTFIFLLSVASYCLNAFLAILLDKMITSAISIPLMEFLCVIGYFIFGLCFINENQLQCPTVKDKLKLLEEEHLKLNCSDEEQSFLITYDSTNNNTYDIKQSERETIGNDNTTDEYTNYRLNTIGLLDNKALFSLSKTFLLMFIAELGDRTSIISLYYLTYIQSWIVITACFLSRIVLIVFALINGIIIKEILTEKATKIISGVIMLSFCLIEVGLLTIKHLHIIDYESIL